MFTNLLVTMQPKQRPRDGWVCPMTTKPNKYLMTTPEAMALTGWSTATLQRRVKAGLIHSHPDPRDKRRVLWDHAELTSVAFPQPHTRNPNEYALEDLAMVKFADLLADYVDKPRDEFLESVRNTPVSLLPGILEMALYLAHNTIEDDVAHATPEQIEQARKDLGE